MVSPARPPFFSTGLELRREDHRLNSSRKIPTKVKKLQTVSGILQTVILSMNLQGKPGEGLGSPLLGARHAGRVLGQAVAVLEVLSREDEGRQPPKRVSRHSNILFGKNIQVGEDNVNQQDESAENVGHKRRDEGRQEEENRDHSNSQVVDQVRATMVMADEV